MPDAEISAQSAGPSARRIFPRCLFNEKTTQAGIEALGFYHEKKDEAHNIGLGPERPSPPRNGSETL